ncbi:MAG: nucleotidyltransferase family protein [Lachnospiraceae bacterium]|nr:nucleotidyltransferase family protein [Lachnospiraceae bacterium]
MGKAAGIIAEYNPFHLGHQYQIERTRQLTKADYIVVVMSGNFVQRGEPAVFEKFQRARMALLGGADLVLELPAPFAAGSAEDFASAAVSLLDGLGAVSFLSFGSECGNLDLLKEAARCLIREPEPFREELKNRLRQGAAFPAARRAALEACGLSKDALEAADAPNNLLGMEYLKALERLGSRIQPVTVLREGCGYHDTALSPARFASASALRKAFADVRLTDLPPELAAQLPPELLPLYRSGELLPICPDDSSALLNYKILSCLAEGIPFQEYADFSPELAGRLENQAYPFRSFSDRAAALKTRQYTYTRVSRSLTHLLLDIRQSSLERCRRTGYVSYARVLGFRKTAAPLLREIKEKSTLPLITKAADAPAVLSRWQEEHPESSGADCPALWNQDIFCSHLYHILQQQKYGTSPANEYSRPLVLL